MSNNTFNETTAQHDFEETTLWVCVALCLMMGIVSAFGNGLVLYVSNKKDDHGGFCQINWVVKNLALSDFLYGIIGSPLTIVFWYWGQFGELETQHMNTSEWQTALLRAFYVPFQNCSCYFVLFAVCLRVRIIRNPMAVERVVSRRLKIVCSTVWVLAMAINMMPVLSSIPPIRRSTTDGYRIDMVCSYLAVLHIGVTFPLIITIVSNLYLSISLKKMERKKRRVRTESFLRETSDTSQRNEKSNSASYQKLTNRLVIWLFICKVPYIAWYHWSLNHYMENDGVSWHGVEGVIFTALARLLVICNSSVNPMVYASTIPDFKQTLRKIFFRDNNPRQSIVYSKRTTLSQVRISSIPKGFEENEQILLNQNV